VLLSWLSSRFVNDESLRRVGLLAWDDVIACHARNLLRYVFGTIRPEVIQLVSTLRSVWCRLQNLHEAWTTTPAGIPRIRRAGGVDLRTGWLRAWRVMVPDVLTLACCR